MLLQDVYTVLPLMMTELFSRRWKAAGTKALFEPGGKRTTPRSVKFVIDSFTPVVHFQHRA